MIWGYDMVGKSSHSGHIYTYRGLITISSEIYNYHDIVMIILTKILVSNINVEGEIK